MTAHTTRELKQARATRTPFTHAEDLQLLKLVEVLGENCWRIISSTLPNRSAKQCRDRYFNSLAPRLSNGEWSEDEERLLYEKVQEIGTKWSVLSKFFTNRGPNNIKNHWNRVMMRKQASFAAPAEQVPKVEVEPFQIDFDFIDNENVPLLDNFVE